MSAPPPMLDALVELRAAADRLLRALADHDHVVELDVDAAGRVLSPQAPGGEAAGAAAALADAVRAAFGLPATVPVRIACFYELRPGPAGGQREPWLVAAAPEVVLRL